MILSSSARKVSTTSSSSSSSFLLSCSCVTTTSGGGNAFTTRRLFSSFAVNMETAAPATGQPRGLINRMSALGLPPWAAWTRNLDQHAMYRLSGASMLHFLPKYPQDMENIWGNEKVRERVRSTADKQYMFRELKYPLTRTGVWFSDSLDHWVQVPHVKGAAYDIERDGGMDSYILKRSGSQLKSKYGERLRRNILVRQREIEKNFLLQKTAEKLASEILEDPKEKLTHYFNADQLKKLSVQVEQQRQN